MEYKIVFLVEKTINKDLLKIPKNNRILIVKKLKLLSKNWLKGVNIKKLADYSQADFRLRVWDYRILFDIDEDKAIIKVIRILHRSKLY
jgi:mRNA interferase RelE/StbE